MVELGKQYNCGNCVALCCRKGVNMELSEAEVAFMQRGGTELSEVSPPTPETSRRVKFLPLITRTQPAQNGTYRLESDCGYLTVDTETGQKICGAYEDPQRPEVCDAFKAGEYGCMTMRVLSGVDTDDEYDLFLQKSAVGE